jgi:hypothetical protein
MDGAGISVTFLLTDLDAAMTFMDVAEVSTIPENIRQGHENARKAYKTVLRLLCNVHDAMDRKAVTDKLAVLKRRLEAVGHQF